MDSKNITLTILSLFLSFLACGQNSISGIISDEQTQEPVPFASILNLRTQNGTTSDFQGKFHLDNTNEQDSIKIQMAGYQTQVVLAQNSHVVQMSQKSITLESVVVSANREQEKRTEAPIAITSIGPKTIAENNPTTIDQIVNQSAGVYMVDLGNEQHTMSIRRPIDYGASYLYLEDGVPIRTSGIFNHNALLEMNMANTSRIEIIRGPASSMYGSEAIGGAINFISPKPSVNPSAGISLQGNNIGYKRTDFHASNSFQKLGVRMAGYYAQTRDGYREHSDMDKLALSLALNYSFSQNTELVWSSSYIDYFSDMSGSLDSARFFSKNYQSVQTFTNRQVDAFRSKLALNHYWNDRSKSSVTAYYRNNTIKQNPSYRVADDFKPWIPSGNPNKAHGVVNDYGFESVGMIAQHKQDFTWLNASLVGGVSMEMTPSAFEEIYTTIYKSDAGYYESFTATDSALADFKTDLVNTSAYAQLKIEPVKNLRLIGALRYDNFTYKFDNNLGPNSFTAVQDGENVFNQFTPKVGLTYDLMNNSGFYANFSQGFVPPQVSELYRGQKIPALKPVYYNSYEVGGWVAFANKKAKLEVSYYIMDGKDEIISVRYDDGTYGRKNAGETRHKGIEYALLYQPVKSISLRISGTNASHNFTDYVESGTDFSGNEMALSPGWIANAQITYRPSWLKGFRTSVEWQHIDEYYMDAANTKTYPGYDIFNLRLGYEWKAFEIWSNIINLTDELYATVASASQWGESYTPGNPRNFNLGIAYKFSKK
ncbi:TonB-dependent receptor [Flexithrix dorotheae]|uniref:TonB-dependent receptor n=1 Tax=Flexithrix dorotheae TaxID=70993 RepID=UPI000372BB08|nr:TonB-dependent receptor [Flexithrix dorotheae]